MGNFTLRIVHQPSMSLYCLDDKVIDKVKQERAFRHIDDGETVVKESDAGRFLDLAAIHGWKVRVRNINVKSEYN